MPHLRPEKELAAAEAAVIFATETRRHHRRRTAKDAPARKTDIERALKRISDAMAPLRSEIGRFPRGPTTDRAETNRSEIRDASAALQRERRKLWKMRNRG